MQKLSEIINAAGFPAAPQTILKGKKMTCLFIYVLLFKGNDTILK